MKEIIARDLCSYQFEPNSKQSVCDLLGFNIKDFRIETQKNLMLNYICLFDYLFISS